LGSAGAKAVHRTLMKLTPDLNFFNILLATFASPDPKSVKNNDNLNEYFALLGTWGVKAARTKNVDEIDPRSRERVMEVMWCQINLLLLHISLPMTFSFLN